jgi:FtsP/CotA-like multicopper oxidase with cupredoxin domain
VILERDDDVAPAWRERWDSLKLFTPRRFNSLPGLDFPGEPDGYPGRDEVHAYLKDYVAKFDLPVALRARALGLSRQDGRFLIELDDGPIAADQVVIATGPFQEARIPAFASGLAAEVVQLHSTAYRRPSDLPAGPTLVVGGGNTGFQIAEELLATRETHLAIGGRQVPLPQRFLGRDLFWWLTTTGLINKSVETKLGKRASRRDTLVGSTPRKSKRRGVILHGRAASASGRTVKFENGSSVEVDGVVWATGFRGDYGWIDLPLTDETGRVRHTRGVTEVPGLYTLGLQWQYTRGSALLGFVKDDAAFIAEQIAAERKTRRLTMQEHNVHPETPHAEAFPTDPTGLPASPPAKVVELRDGELFEMTIEPVAKRLGDATVRMLGYHGSIPGPTLRVPEGAEILVKVENRGDLETTVHWHGLRLENAFDGTHETQTPLAFGESFVYRVRCPDPGVYWYHPHIREDYGQELGLYGNLIVVPREEGYWAPAHREVAITLDDILIEDGKVASFLRDDTTYAAMGRFGNVMLAAGQADLTFPAERDEVVRLYLTNTANTRVFNVGFAGARMKLVGGDSGRCEHERFVDSVILAPSERAVIDVLFDTVGEAVLQHRTPDTVYPLARVAVAREVADPGPAGAFETLRHNPEFVELRERIAPYREAAADKSLAFVAEMEFEEPEGPVVYTCPMHPEVVSDAPGSCPECGMKLMPTAAVSHGEADDQHEHHHGHDESHNHGHADGIEWEDDMVEVNRTTSLANTRWKLIDRQSGAENQAIDWQFRVGDWVKIELVNEMDSDHPMHHPFHVHGAGRFLVLDRDGVEDDNLVWKDTVLVRTGERVNILLEVTNPGRWMAHCHIAEHHESGMMFSFEVTT